MRVSHLALLMFLGGCSLVPDYQQSDVNPAMPESWKQATPMAATPDIAQDWWKGFNSEELNTLIAQALEQNNDLRAALARIEQARATTAIAGSTLLPNADASGSASRSDSDSSSPDKSYRGQLRVSYEVDLFGRNRAGLSAAEARLEATRFDRDALALITIADVSDNYFEVVSLRERLRIARQNLSAVKEVLDIVNARFEEGAASALEASQQRSAYATAEAQLASLERELSARENSLAILLGQTPQSLTVKNANFDGIAAPTPAATMPSELLTRRPDIARAEAQLIAANADIGAARTAFFPSLNLNVDAALLASPSAATSSLLASLVAPIFQGGRLTGELDRVEARQMELVETYRKTVLVAFQDVEDALAFLRSADIRQTQLQTAAEEARIAYNLARERFDAGAIDFQTLLDTQRSMLQADDSFVQAKRDRLAASIALYQALGGGWNSPISAL